METVEQTACRLLCQFCYVDNIFASEDATCRRLSGLHCNIDTMTENEGDSAILSTLTLVLT